jgi:hypothetical protein
LGFFISRSRWDIFLPISFSMTLLSPTFLAASLTHDLTQCGLRHRRWRDTHVE